MEEVSSKYVTGRGSIEGVPHEDDFEIMTSTITTFIEPRSNRVVIKCLQISIDPAHLNRMKPFNQSHNCCTYTTLVPPGKTIDGYGIGRVMDSGHPEFQKDDIVAGMLIWAEYVVLEDAKFLRKLNSMEFPLSYHLGILGLSGLTAYTGLMKICKPKKGEKILVSAASGAVGNLVGQFAKLFGCYVVGCAGTSQKVTLLKEKLGFDDAFNYKEEDDLKVALKRYFPDGIDMYFDNVGGEILEAAVLNMNPYGRVAVCGVISQYTDPTKKLHAPDMMDVIYKRITIQGFFALDFVDECFEDFTSTATEYLRGSQIQVLENISHGLESVPSAFVGLFLGTNIGKTIVQLSV